MNSDRVRPEMANSLSAADDPPLMLGRSAFPVLEHMPRRIGLIGITLASQERCWSLV
jgi:hypothetical protein